MLSSTTRAVSRYTLENGLTLLIKENHTAPVVAILAHVGIGYFHEPDRWNGLSHVVEHMFFKGTRLRPGKEQIAQEIRALGGSLNASTYYEETAYHTTLPSLHFEKAVEIQADTFLNSLYDGEELAKELEVIIQESKQKRDNPGAMLVETLYAQAHDRHRIRRWRIGDDETLRSFRHDDLVQFVAQTYRPENIVLSIVGDVDTQQAHDIIERYWGKMPRGTFVKEASPPEPPRQGFRYHRMQGDIQQRLLTFGFPAPPVLHADAPALFVLDALLSDGRSARLYRRLKEEQGLVNAAWAGYEGFHDLGIFTLGAEIIGDDPLPTERALFAEIARLREATAQESELQRIKTRIESRRIYGQEEVLGMARTLAAYEALGDYRLADEFLTKLQNVTAEDVRRVTETYLVPERATLVEYLPKESPVPEPTAAAIAGEITAALRSPAPERVPDETFVPSPRLDAPEEIRLSSGATLLYRRRTDLPLVAVQVLFSSGKRAETVQTAGMTSLMLKSMLKGTTTRRAADIAGEIELLGSSIGQSAGLDHFGFGMKLLRDRLPEGMAILSDVLCNPTFPTEEVAREKQALYGEIRRLRDSISSHTMDLFNRACYGTQAYGLPPSGIVGTIETLTEGDLRAWHTRFVRSGNAVIAVVGDIEREPLIALLEKALPYGESLPADGIVIVPGEPKEIIETSERNQTASALGFVGAAVTDDSRYALNLLSEITSGLAGRFFQAVRGDNALAYAVTSFHRSRRDGGNFVTYTATSPDKELLVREILLEECARLTREPVTQEELDRAKEAIRGEQVIYTQTFNAQAGELAASRLYGLPLDAPTIYLARILAVTAEEIQAAAAETLRPDRAWLGVVRGTLTDKE